MARAKRKAGVVGEGDRLDDALHDQVLLAGYAELVARHRAEWPELWARIDRRAEVLDQDRR
jgi:hypothetical protein